MNSIRLVSKGLDKDTLQFIRENRRAQAAPVKSMTRRRLVTALLGALVGGLPLAGLHAMTMHVNGKQLILSGSTLRTDGYLFANTVRQLKAQGLLKNIDTVVLRNAPGGAVVSGDAISDQIRRLGWTTVVSGFCVSACSRMSAGGVKRAFADDDQPFMVHEPLNEGMGQFIGIHGASSVASDGKRTLSVKTSEGLYDFYLRAIADGDPDNTNNEMLKDAMSDHGAAYVRLWDPAAAKQPSVYWCHSDCTTPSQYKAYLGTDVYNTGFITETQRVATTDTLLVNKDVSGNINARYLNLDEPGAINPITPLGRLFDQNGFHITGNSAFPNTSMDDVLLELYENNPVAHKLVLESLLKKVLVDYTENYSPAQFKAFLKDPNSSLMKDIAAIRAGGPVIDSRAVSLGDSYGIIHVTNGATWTLPQGVHGAADTLIIDQGRLRLDGGTLNIPQTFVGAGGKIEGSGSIGQVYSQNPDTPNLIFRHGAVLHPTGDGIQLAGYKGSSAWPDAANASIDLGDASLSLNIRPNQQQALLRLESTETYKRDSVTEYGLQHGGKLTVSPQSSLALNVAPDFYPSHTLYPLVAPELTQWLGNIQAADPARFKTLDPATVAKYQEIISRAGGFVTGKFVHVVRADADGNPLAGYDIDPTAKDAQKASFHPFDDSLVSYRLMQNGNNISLRANDAFLNNPALCGLAGCGLGTALSHASQQSNTAMAPLLGALQFSTTADVTKAREQLEGASYASQRTASLNLINDFTSVVNLHLLSADREGEQAANVLSASASTMGLGGRGHSVDAAGMLRYLVENDGAAVGSGPTLANGPVVWGHLFGHQGRLDGQQEVAALRQDSAGLVFGVDHRPTEQLTWGTSLGYGKLNANGVDNGFRGHTRAVDARLYLNYATDRHYVNLIGGLTHLNTSATRSVDLSNSQFPFAATARNNDTGTAISLHLEHGWTLHDRRGWTWQPIFPSLDLVRLPTVDAQDKTDSPAIALNVHAKKVIDARIGAGLQVAKTFELASGTALTPHARVLLQHAFRNHEGYFTNNFANDPQGPAFDVRGANSGRNHAQVNVGLTARRTDRLAFLIDYVGDFTAHSRDQGIALGAQYRW